MRPGAGVGRREGGSDDHDARRPFDDIADVDRRIAPGLHRRGQLFGMLGWNADQQATGGLRVEEELFLASIEACVVLERAGRRGPVVLRPAGRHARCNG